MAHAILRPSVVDFIEISTASENLELQIEEVSIHPSSEISGKSLVDSGIRQSMGIIIVGVKLTDNKMTFNQPPYTIIEPNSVLITLGERSAIDNLEKIAGGLQQ